MEKSDPRGESLHGCDHHTRRCRLGLRRRQRPGERRHTGRPPRCRAGFHREPLHRRYRQRPGPRGRQPRSGNGYDTDTDYDPCEQRSIELGLRPGGYVFGNGEPDLGEPNAHGLGAIRRGRGRLRRTADPQRRNGQLVATLSAGTHQIEAIYTSDNPSCFYDSRTTAFLTQVVRRAAYDHRRQPGDVFRRAPAAIDGQLPRVRQRRDAGQPDCAADPDHDSDERPAPSAATGSTRAARSMRTTTSVTSRERSR